MSDRKQAEIENPHLTKEPTVFGSPLDSASLAVLAVHGRGQSPEYMRGLAERIDIDDIGYLALEADGGSWYPEGFLLPLEANQPYLDHAVEAVLHHLRRLIASGRPLEEIVVFGFSQGACLLSEVLLRTGMRPAAALLHTGGYPGPEEREAPLAEDAFAGMSAYFACSRADAWVPLHRAEATATAFAAAGASVKFDTYDGGVHEVNDDSIHQIRKLLLNLSCAGEGRAT